MEDWGAGSGRLPSTPPSSSHAKVFGPSGGRFRGPPPPCPREEGSALRLWVRSHTGVRSGRGGGGAGLETSLPVYTAGPGGALRPGRFAGEERARAGAAWRRQAGLAVASGRWPVGRSRG